MTVNRARISGMGTSSRLARTVALAPGKARVVQKEAIARLYSRVAPVYLVNEYPKSGGTWLKYMLADALDLPAWTLGSPAWGSCVMQAHWLEARGNCRVLALFRDGRDVMVSYYFHSFFRNEFNNGSYVDFMRSKFPFDDYADVRGNLLPFMQAMLNDPVSPSFTWVDFVRRWAHRPGVVRCHYDALRTDAAACLTQLTMELSGQVLPAERAAQIVSDYSMDNMAVRARELNPRVGEDQAAEISFVREGSVGGWTNRFTDEALDWFESQAGDELLSLGYELGRPS